MNVSSGFAAYFPHDIQISRHSWNSHDLGALSRHISERGIPAIIFHRQLALRLNRQRSHGGLPVHAGQLNLFAALQTIFRYLIDVAAEQEVPRVLENALRQVGVEPSGEAVQRAVATFVELFPPADVLSGASSPDAWLNPATGRGGRRRTVLRELLLLRLAAQNPALDSFREILDDAPLVAALGNYPQLVTAMTTALSRGPRLSGFDLTLPEILFATIKIAQLHIDLALHNRIACKFRQNRYSLIVILTTFGDLRQTQLRQHIHVAFFRNRHIIFFCGIERIRCGRDIAQQHRGGEPLRG